MLLDTPCKLNLVCSKLTKRSSKKLCVNNSVFFKFWSDFYLRAEPAHLANICPKSILKTLDKQPPSKNLRVQSQKGLHKKKQVVIFFFFFFFFFLHWWKVNNFFADTFLLFLYVLRMFLFKHIQFNLGTSIPEIPYILDTDWIDTVLFIRLIPQIYWWDLICR